MLLATFFTDRSTMTNGQGQIDEKYQRSRTETYHGPLTDISDTDYAMSVSRYNEILG